ncbi:rho guanine nucleotide exchange factor [Dispira parvispora]|uniref:Rho guanine nucleotide exchange factor n=1 Tax=Dispira parvispora TaxID=1520584 RepID=A0A9W8AVM9_9FUNG|nr:rho guanine nucleotide exchange factor [Dispira parvispora]
MGYQRSYVTLARRDRGAISVDLPDDDASSNHTAIMVGIIVACVVVIAALIGFFVYRGYRRAAKRKAAELEDSVEPSGEFNSWGPSAALVDPSYTDRNTGVFSHTHHSVAVSSNYRSGSFDDKHVNSYLRSEASGSPIPSYLHSQQNSLLRPLSAVYRAGEPKISDDTHRDSFTLSRDSTFIEAPQIMRFATIRQPNTAFGNHHAATTSVDYLPGHQKTSLLSQEGGAPRSESDPHPPPYDEVEHGTRPRQHSLAKSVSTPSLKPSTLAETSDLPPQSSNTSVINTKLRGRPSVRSSSRRKVTRNAPVSADGQAESNSDSKAHPTTTTTPPSPAGPLGSPLPSVVGENGEPLPIVGTAQAVLGYDPQMDDELAITVGDTIALIQVFDDGWAHGVNLSQDGTQGVFPYPCVQSTPSA